MSTNNKKSDTFEFNKSLKGENLFTFLKYLPADRYIFRTIASLIVRAVYNTSVTPNQLTWFSLYLGILSGILYCFGEPLYFIIGGILLQLSLVFDCADGMLARSKDMCSRFGAYLDLFFDRILDFFFLGGMVIGQYVYSGNLKILIAGVFAIALLFLEINLDYITRNYNQREKTGEASEAKSLFIFISFIFTLLNRLDIFILGMMFGTAIIISIRLLTFPASNRTKK